MTDIFIIGDKNDDRLGSLIRNRLISTYRITYLKENCFFRDGKGYELICFDSESPVIKGSESAVVVLKSGGRLPDYIPEKAVVIINADSEEQRKAVQERKIPAIVCGISDTSTVSFSSETESTLVVTLNREIQALSGRMIQPLEIPIKKLGENNETLMSYTALRLILDDFDSELRQLI